jgi:hypothetical protein
MPTKNVTNWLITQYACSIDAQIDNVKAIYALNINKEKFFKQGAKSFLDWANRPDSIVYKCVMQLFFRFGQELISKFKLFTEKDDNFGAEDDRFDLYIKIYLESVVKDNKDKAKNKFSFHSQDGGHEYTDYTYYIFLCDPNGDNTFDGNKVWGDLLSGNVKEAEIKQKSDNIRRRGGADGYTGDSYSEFEKWKLANTRFTLSELFDGFTGEVNATQVADVTEMTGFHKSSNPLTASKFYSLLCAYWTRSDDAIPDQSPFNWRQYWKEMPNKPGLGVFTFPRRKFVQRLTLGSFKMEQLCTKVFPEYQIKTTESLGAVLPVIIHDTHYRSSMRERRLKADPDRYLREQIEKDKKVDPRPAELIAKDWFDERRETGGIENDVMTFGNDNDDNDEDNDDRRGTQLQDLEAMAADVRDTISKQLFGSDDDEAQEEEPPAPRKYLDKRLYGTGRDDDDEDEEEFMKQLGGEKAVADLERKLLKMRMRRDESDSSAEEEENEDNRQQLVLDNIMVPRKTKRQVLIEMAKFMEASELITEQAIPLKAKDVAMNALIGSKRNSGPNTTLDPNEFAGYMDFYTSSYQPIICASRNNMNAITELYKAKNRSGSVLSKTKNPELVVRKLLIMNKIQAFGGYYHTCRTPDADLSPYERAVLKAISEGLYENVIIRFNKIDKSITAFGSWEIKSYGDLETKFLVANTHREANLIVKYSWNRWWVDYGLHTNAGFISKVGGAGKSFLLDLLKKVLIDGTVEEETDRSEKAEATSERNRNGRAVLMHEINKRLIQEDSKSSTSDRERQFKEIFTSNRNRTRRLMRQEDGTFRQEFTDSECISVYFFCSNLNIYSMMSDAFRSRIHLIYFEERAKINERSIMELKLAEVMLSPAEKGDQARRCKEYHLLDALFMEVERLIFLDVLTDVSMHVAMVILLIMNNRLKQAGMDRAHPRDYVRTLLLSRANCILDALIHTFFLPTSKFYGKPIDPHTFLYLDRRLFCTTEHVIAAIGEQLDQYVDPTEKTIILGIRHMFNTNSNKHSLFQVNMVLGPDPKEPGKMANTLQTDPTYIRFRKSKNWSSFCNDITVATKSLGIDDVVFTASEHTVSKTLDAWKKRTISSKSYRLDPKSQNKGEVIVDTESEEANMVICKEDAYAVFFHYGFIFNQHRADGRDTIVNIIKDIFTKDEQRNIPHRFIFDNDVNHPYIRNIIETGMDGDESGEPKGFLTIPTAVCIDHFARELLYYERHADDPDDDDERAAEKARAVLNDENIGDSFFHPIDTDLDSYGAQQRNEVLFIGSYKVNDDFLALSCLSDTHKIGTVETSKDENGIPSDGDYNTDMGYFLGIPLPEVLKSGSNTNDTEFTKEQIKAAIDNLDEKDSDLEKPDYDFDPEDFIVEGTAGSDNVTYHWEYLDGNMSDPKMYKLMCYHPLIVDHYINLTTCKKLADTSDYPEGFKKRAEAARKDRWQKAESYCSTKGQLLSELLKGQKFLTYELGYDKNNKRIIKRKENSPYTAVSSAVRGIVKDTPSLKQRRITETSNDVTMGTSAQAQQSSTKRSNKGPAAAANKKSVTVPQITTPNLLIYDKQRSGYSSSSDVEQRVESTTIKTPTFDYHTKHQKKPASKNILTIGKEEEEVDIDGDEEIADLDQSTSSSTTTIRPRLNFSMDD